MEKLMVPVELDITESINLYPVDDLSGFHKDKVYFVCDCIYRGMEKLNAGMIHPDKREPYFVPLRSDILSKMLGGNNYKGILDWMEAACIIIPDCSWKAGKVSQGYRFTDYFLNSDLTWKTVRCWTLLKKEVNECFEKKIHFQPIVVNRLEKWFQTNKLEIDLPKCYETIEIMEAAAFRDANENNDKIRQARINTEINTTKVEILDQIERGKYLFKQDEFGYRIHTSITQLPREFRSFVSYDKKQLVEVDISCSQLFFSIFLFNHRHWKYKSSKPYLVDLWKHLDISSSNNRVEYYNTIMSINSYETFYGKGFQNHDFVKKCSEGLLYESILDKLATDGIYQPNHDYQVKRNKVKNILLDQLFADATDPNNRGLFCRANKPILDSFTALYPGVLEVYRRIKEVNYKDICSLFQRIESIAMTGYVCKRLQRDYPEVPIFTLHDCLITTVGNEMLVSRIMAECIDEFVGYVPKMKIKYWRDYAKEIDQYLEGNKAA